MLTQPSQMKELIERAEVSNKEELKAELQKWEEDITVTNLASKTPALKEMIRVRGLQATRTEGDDPGELEEMIRLSWRR